MKNIIKCVGVAPLVCLISICCVVQEFADISIFVLGLDMSLLASALLIIRSARLVPSLTSRVFSTGGPLSSLPSPSDEPLSSPDPKPFSDIPGDKNTSSIKGSETRWWDHFEGITIILINCVVNEGLSYHNLRLIRNVKTNARLHMKLYGMVVNIVAICYAHSLAHATPRKKSGGSGDPYIHVFTMFIFQY